VYWYPIEWRKGSVQDRADELVASDGASGVAQERLEKIELDGGQLDRFTAAANDPRCFVDRDVVDNQFTWNAHVHRTAFDPRPPQNRFDASTQFARVERFRQVVVGPHLEAEDSILLVAACSEHQHRHASARTQLPEYLEAPHVRQHDVEHNQRVFARQRPFDPLGAAVDRLHVVPLWE
jgi:hypothetical protein